MIKYYTKSKPPEQLKSGWSTILRINWKGWLDKENNMRIVSNGPFPCKAHLGKKQDLCKKLKACCDFLKDSLRY
jgi:hypothetical protein